MKKLLPILFLCFVLTSNTIAQTGIIKGTLREALSGKSVEYASVQLEGTSFGALTDSAGFFEIKNLTPGIYNVRITSVGYKSKGIPEVEVTNAKPATLNLEIEVEATEISEVVVQANPFTKKMKVRFQFAQYV